MAELRKQRDASLKVEFQLREQTTDMEQRLHVFEERVEQLTNEKKFFQERNGKYFDEKYEAQERVRELIKASSHSCLFYCIYAYNVFMSTFTRCSSPYNIDIVVTAIRLLYNSYTVHYQQFCTRRSPEVGRNRT